MIPAGPHPLMMCGGADPLDEYFKVGHGVRFNAADSPSLMFTPAVAGNSKTFTINFTLKRTALDTAQVLFHANGSTSAFKIYFNGADNVLWVDANNAGALTFQAKGLNVLRDLAAHADVTVSIDTTQATKEAGVRIEVDGRDVTAFNSSNWTQNADTWWNRSGVVHSIGRGTMTGGGTYSADAILSNIRHVDGQFLSSSAFRRVHPRTGQGRPIRYSGSYGTLGFWLDFEDGSAATSAALGKDRSGNNNDWTPANISVAAGAGCDWLLDTSTNNFPTINPLHQRGSNTISNGNLDFTLAAGVTSLTATQSISSGKWYWETTFTAVSAGALSSAIGIVKTSISAAALDVFGVGGVSYYSTSGIKYVNGSSSAYGATFTLNDVIGIALDCDASTITFYKNNVSQGVISIDEGASWLPAITNGTGVATQSGNFNFGQRALAYSPPAGFKALCTKNLPIKPAGPMKSTDAYVAVTDTGANIQASLAAASPWANWIRAYKLRGGSEGWRFVFSDDPANYLDTSSTNEKAEMPALSGSYFGFALKVAASNGIATGTFVHTNGVNSVVNDGLSNARKMVWLKRESTGGGVGYVYHPDLTAGKLFYLEQHAGETTDASINTVTASGFTAASTLPSGTYRWISFAEVDGFSKATKFNSQDAFSNFGLSPGLTLLKRIESSSDFFEWDITRTPSNVISADLYINSPAAENSSLVRVDLVSNGLKSRAVSGNNPNVSGATYVTFNFAAFPFRYANAR